MYRVDPQVRSELAELQKRAKNKRSWEQTFLSDRQIVMTVNDWFPQTNSLLLIDAIKQDLKLMPLYEAVATWCDSDNGLSNQFPLQILEIAKKLLPEEQDNGDIFNSQST